jgi:hypothetical protein
LQPTRITIAKSPSARFTRGSFEDGARIRKERVIRIRLGARLDRARSIRHG